MKIDGNQSIKEDFNKFLDTPSIIPPSHLSKKIHNRIQRDLNPPIWMVFGKLVLGHVIVGPISLTFCSQFGMGQSHHSGNEFTKFVMSFGMETCMMVCGAIFLTFSLLAASLILRIEELRIIRKTRFLQVLGLGLLSIGAFVCMGRNLVFSLTMFWITGAAIGGIIAIEVTWWVRKRNSAFI
jgi:hypothetical protein